MGWLLGDVSNGGCTTVSWPHRQHMLQWHLTWARRTAIPAAQTTLFAAWHAPSVILSSWCATPSFTGCKCPPTATYCKTRSRPPMGSDLWQGHVCHLPQARARGGHIVPCWPPHMSPSSTILQPATPHCPAATKGFAALVHCTFGLYLILLPKVPVWTGLLVDFAGGGAWANLYSILSDNLRHAPSLHYTEGTSLDSVKGRDVEKLTKKKKKQPLTPPQHVPLPPTRLLPTQTTGLS